MAVDDLPQPGVDAYEIFRKIDRGEIKELLSLCFNPIVSLPDNTFIRAQLEKLEFYVAIDFFLNETARYADIVLPGSLHEEDEGVVTTAEERVIKINQAVTPPGDARQDWRIIQDIAGAMGRPQGMDFAGPAEVFAELRRASQGGVADYSGISYEKSRRRMASSGPARPTIIWGRRACLNRGRGIRWRRAAARFISPTAKPASMWLLTRRPPRMWMTSTRLFSQPAASSASFSPGSRRGALALW